MASDSHHKKQSRKTAPHPAAGREVPVPWEPGAATASLQPLGHGQVPNTAPAALRLLGHELARKASRGFRHPWSRETLRVLPREQKPQMASSPPPSPPPLRLHSITQWKRSPWCTSTPLPDAQAALQSDFSQIPFILVLANVVISTRH